jgi:hypothetical protein
VTGRSDRLVGVPRALHILGLLAASLTCGCNLLLTDWKTSESAGAGGAAGGGGGAGGAAGGGGAGGGASAFCARKTHAFCESFDDKGFLADWDDDPQIDPATTLGLVKGVDVSAPSALRVALPALGVNKQKTATLKKTLPLTAPRAVVELDLDFATPAWNDQEQQHNVAFLNLFSDGDPANGVILFLGNNTLEVVPVNPGDSKFAPHALPTGAFTHVKLELDQASSTDTILLYVGDPPELLVSEDVTFASSPGDSVILTLGLQRFTSATDTTPAFEATYDNVTVDFVP